MYDQHGPGHSQCSKMRRLFTLMSRLLQNMNQKGIWVGHDTRRTQTSESVSPPREDSIGFPTVIDSWKFRHLPEAMWLRGKPDWWVKRAYRLTLTWRRRKGEMPPQAQDQRWDLEGWRWDAGHAAGNFLQWCHLLKLWGLTNSCKPRQ